MPLTLSGTNGVSGVDGTASNPSLKGGTSTTAGVVYPAADTVAISTASTERLRVDSNGRVGIGTTSPDAGALMTLYSSTNTPFYLTSGDATNCYQYFKDAGSSAYQVAIGSSANKMKFVTGGAVNMLLDASGYLLCGYTSSNGAYKLQVNSQIFATSATIATSDARYKENIEPITDGLALVNALNPVSFDWKQHPVHAFDTEHKTVGFLAQEVQTALADKPYVNSIIKESECELPDGTKEKFLGIAEGNMVSILTSAIKELSAKLDAAEARIAALEAK